MLMLIAALVWISMDQYGLVWIGMAWYGVVYLWIDV